MEFIEKYIDRDGLFDSVMKNKLEGIYQDLKWGMPVFNASWLLVIDPVAVSNCWNAGRSWSSNTQ